MALQFQITATEIRRIPNSPLVLVKLDSAEDTQRLLHSETFNVDWFSVTAELAKTSRGERRRRFVQCTNCWNTGHHARVCRSHAICKFCCSPEHTHSNCPVARNPNSHRCRLCNTNTHHNGSRNCAKLIEFHKDLRIPLPRPRRRRSKALSYRAVASQPIPNSEPKPTPVVVQQQSQPSIASAPLEETVLEQLRTELSTFRAEIKSQIDTIKSQMLDSVHSSSDNHLGAMVRSELQSFLQDTVSTLRDDLNSLRIQLSQMQQQMPLLPPAPAFPLPLQTSFQNLNLGSVVPPPLFQPPPRSLSVRAPSVPVPQQTRLPTPQTFQQTQQMQPKQLLLPPATTSSHRADWRTHHSVVDKPMPDAFATQTRHVPPNPGTKHNPKSQ